MIFVPFTGVDNHRHCVTFGAGLIFSETTESYKWLLEFFLKAHNKQPSLVLTDQDPSMRQAVLQVMPQSRHRLCMWHIMKKLPSKISGDLMQNTDLRARIHQLVWSNYMKTTTFERRWNELIKEFDLREHEWLAEMYNIRDRWVPAFFRDIPMCGLLRTTSVCESSNSSFKVNSTSANTLVQFMMCFESRVEQQRYNQRTSDFKTSSVSFLNIEATPIEKHAFQLYTSTIFLEVHKEIKEGMRYCYISNTEVLGVTHVYSVSQVNPENGLLSTYEVKYNTVEKVAECSCRCFTRIGYLCRHVFCAFQVNRLNEIPQTYISKRWTKNALPRSVYRIENRYGVDTSVESVLRREVLELMNDCVDDLRADKVGLENLVEKMRELKNCIMGDLDASTIVDNSEIRTKGCGKRRRVSGPGEKVREKPPKAPRLCRSCNEYVTDHDSRNCKKKKKGKEVGLEEATEDAM
ncbi:hypothetical protein SSX86_029892 [Deinandra increscens subsp. villosa]|uniref:SWIM-type domain-containing protein n=1 Tax=Deinandra increscens subsp. villosa TaxID=3103831 RepID=A0AAP0CHE2_9ASTR